MIDVTILLSPVATEDLLCPSILVSGAGTSDGLYKMAADQRAAWAPGRQVYERIDGDRYFCFNLTDQYDIVFANHVKLKCRIMSASK